MSEQASSPKADRPTRPKPTPEEIKAKKDHKMAINKTFNKQVNTKDRRFTPLRGVNKYESIDICVNKGENKVKIHVITVNSDLAKNKSTIRKESSHVEEIHQLPPYVKNQNLAGKIKAKYYKGQGVILELPERKKNNRNKDNKDNKNKDGKDSKEAKDDAAEDVNPTQENDGDNEAGEGKKFVEVDISDIVKSAVELPVRFE